MVHVSIDLLIRKKSITNVRVSIKKICLKKKKTKIQRESFTISSALNLQLSEIEARSSGYVQSHFVRPAR